MEKMELSDKYPGGEADPYRDEYAPWLFYNLCRFMRALNHRLCSPQMANRRVSYMYYDKYKYLHEQRIKQNASNDSDGIGPIGD